MKWRGRRGSSNIEDRRGQGGMIRGRGRKATGGFGMGAIILLLASVFFPDAVPLLQMFGVGQGGSNSGYSQQISPQPVPADDEKAQFISVVLADTEEIWTDIFAKAGQRYQEPKLVLFSGKTNSPCGYASAASGPFYCPGDNKVYIDLSFYEVLRRKLGAPGDFAQAYVIAHEVAHHVQNLLGIIPQVDKQRKRSTKVEANRLTVRLELQADCLSGVWANHSHNRFGSLEQGDIEEALNAASAIGDDTLQKRSQGFVVPDSFTHGTSAQRMGWFQRGLKSGDINSCDTFGTNNL